jgi:hypothetical protein
MKGRCGLCEGRREEWLRRAPDARSHARPSSRAWSPPLAAALSAAAACTDATTRPRAGAAAAAETGFEELAARSAASACADCPPPPPSPPPAAPSQPYLGVRKWWACRPEPVSVAEVRGGGEGARRRQRGGRRASDSTRRAAAPDNWGIRGHERARGAARVAPRAHLERIHALAVPGHVVHEVHRSDPRGEQGHDGALLHRTLVPLRIP